MTEIKEKIYPTLTNIREKPTASEIGHLLSPSFFIVRC